MWEPAKNEDRSTVVSAGPNRTELHVCIIYSASSLTSHSLNTVLSSEITKGNLFSLIYLLLTQKCQNWSHPSLCDLETLWGRMDTVQPRISGSYEEEDVLLWKEFSIWN